MAEHQQAEGSAGLLAGKISPTLNLSATLGLDDMLKDLFNTSSSASSSAGGNTVRIGDNSAASGRSAVGNIGLFKTVVYAGIAAVFIGLFFGKK